MKKTLPRSSRAVAVKFLLPLFLALLSTSSASVKPFSCPSYESNKDPMMVN